MTRDPHTTVGGPVETRSAPVSQMMSTDPYKLEKLFFSVADHLHGASFRRSLYKGANTVAIFGINLL